MTTTLNKLNRIFDANIKKYEKKSRITSNNLIRIKNLINTKFADSNKKIIKIEVDEIKKLFDLEVLKTKDTIFHKEISFIINDISFDNTTVVKCSRECEKWDKGSEYDNGNGYYSICFYSASCNRNVRDNSRCYWGLNNIIIKK